MHGHGCLGRGGMSGQRRSHIMKRHQCRHPPLARFMHVATVASPLHSYFIIACFQAGPMCLQWRPGGVGEGREDARQPGVPGNGSQKPRSYVYEYQCSQAFNLKQCSLLETQ